MRLNKLFESAPGTKGKTTASDASSWLLSIEKGEASEKDIHLYNELKKISKSLGGKTTVIEILKLM